MREWNFSRIQIVCADIKAKDREGAIREMAERVRRWREIDDFTGFVEDVLRREALQATGVGHEVALPHARTSNVNKFVMIFGRSREGIDFGAPDRKPARLIFLMGIPKGEIRGYLQLLKYLSVELTDGDLRQRVMEAKSEEEIIAVFRAQAQAAGPRQAVLSYG